MRNMVLFGDIEFGDFLKDGGRDKFPCAIVHEIQCQLMMEEEEADDFMVKHSYGGYLIPAEFKGEIYFSGEKDDKVLSL
jgi:hypothetical protein